MSCLLQSLEEVPFPPRVEDDTVYSIDVNLDLLRLRSDNVVEAEVEAIVYGKPIHVSLAKTTQKAVQIVTSEVLDSDTEEDSDTISLETVSSCQSVTSNTIENAFASAQSQWVDDPIISQWRDPQHRIHAVIASLERLYHAWHNEPSTPFSPTTDKLWLSTGRVLADVGLPWHNNQINMPNEIDTSWPFHFKSFENQVIEAKSSRVGNTDPSGYVCNWAEANCYGIRALQQELREKYPSQKPLLVHGLIEIEIAKAAEKLFGLETHHVDWSQNLSAITSNLRIKTQEGSRPIIFAATLTNTDGQYDDMRSICDISRQFPTILHIDASRNFDYITTLTDTQRRELALPMLRLGIRALNEPLQLPDGTIVASTIVAGGPNYTSPAPVVALKPAALGSTHTKVAYTRASDSTLAGSRDALAPLWLALQEIRFGGLGYRHIYRHCEKLRQVMVHKLNSLGVVAVAPKYNLNVIVQDCSETQSQYLISQGAVITQDGFCLLTIQPSVTSMHVQNVVAAFDATLCEPNLRTVLVDDQDFNTSFAVPQDIIDELRCTVRSWKVATRSAAGYPFHMGSYSALGPIIGHFLDQRMPDEWIIVKGNEVLESRLKSFGLECAQDRALFKGAFTNGSTMGNRVGIHTALTHFPGAFLYFSTETHYSVPKTARDCDDLTNRWSKRSCRYSEIPCDVNGSMCAERLLQQALVDREECRQHEEVYRMVLFLNMGTTFVGARDGLGRIRQRLAENDIEISYVHMDGALDFGFDNCGVALGPPRMTDRNGLPVVQGVTLSHHKAMGNMVSGEVLCYSPGTQMAILGSSVEPRAVFETWLYMQAYSQADLIEMFQYCRDNASHLEAHLNDIGVVTKRNSDSIIVVLERPPAWVTEEFSLRPEGDWVHFIAMPHVSRETTDLFVDRISWIDSQCTYAFNYIAPLLSAATGSSITLKRIQCRARLAAKLVDLGQSRLDQTAWSQGRVNQAIRDSLRGAMTVVAVDEREEPQIVFLCDSTRDRKMVAGPVMIQSRLLQSGSKTIFQDVARQLLGFMARHLYAQLEIGEMSFALLPFS